MSSIDRPSWDSTWMKVAETIALRSHHSEFKVGALIVTSDNTQVLSLGYNGKKYLAIFTKRQFKLTFLSFAINL